MFLIVTEALISYCRVGEGLCKMWYTAFPRPCSAVVKVVLGDSHNFNGYKFFTE